jgi:signal transduction histidine kinase
MSLQPHGGTTVDRPSVSKLPVVPEREPIAYLQRMLSGFSHRCRNSLNVIKMSLYLVRREHRGDLPQEWRSLEESCLELERVFDHLQSIYRPMKLTLVRAPLGQFMAEEEPRWRTRLQGCGRTLRVDPPGQDPPGDFDPIHLGMGLDAVVAWRARVREASRHPRLSWRTCAGCSEVCWEEAGTSSRRVDSDGASGPDREHPEPARVESLALPLLARIVTAHGGHTESEREPGRGFCLRLRWPQFQSQAVRP